MGRKNVEVVAVFDMHGKPTPLRVRLLSEKEENIVLKVDKITKTGTDRTAGNIMLKYYCETLLDGISVPFELRYEAATFCWFIYGA